MQEHLHIQGCTGACGILKRRQNVDCWQEWVGNMASQQGRVVISITCEN